MSETSLNRKLQLFCIEYEKYYENVRKDLKDTIGAKLLNEIVDAIVICGDVYLYENIKIKEQYADKLLSNIMHVQTRLKLMKEFNCFKDNQYAHLIEMLGPIIKETKNWRNSIKNTSNKTNDE